MSDELTKQVARTEARRRIDHADLCNECYGRPMKLGESIEICCCKLCGRVACEHKISYDGQYGGLTCTPEVDDDSCLEYVEVAVEDSP